MKVLAIDLYYRTKPKFPVHILDATTMRFPSDCLPVMARPCHGPWVEQAVDNAMKTVDEFLYVGLDRNFSCDLGPLMRRYNVSYPRVDFDAGEDGEEVVIITKKRIDKSAKRKQLR